MNRHLETKTEFVQAYAEFSKALADTGVALSPENTIRLFDMWLANTKDERFLEMQKTQLNNTSDDDDDEPWKKGY